MELAIYNIKGEDTGRKAQLNDQVFAIDANEHAVYLDVKQYLANQFLDQPANCTSRKAAVAHVSVISTLRFS